MDIFKIEKLFNDGKYDLPRRWDGVNFINTLESLFKRYQKDLHDSGVEDAIVSKVTDISKSIMRVLKSYLKGKPAEAFFEFMLMMKIYKDKFFRARPELEIRQALYRVSKVEDNMEYKRKRIFHTPFSLRHLIGTNRYSIPGYPCLYLATSLKLCCDECKVNPQNSLAIASRFKVCLSGNREYVQIMDLGRKPQDFRSNKDKININEVDINNFILMYPLIAACSYIRTNKNNPFSVEYVIPQILLQWLRDYNSNTNNREKLFGIRYFSCSSILASKYGYNYVFPTYTNEEKEDYCTVLKKSFKLTKPVFINEFNSIDECQDSLDRDRNLDFI